MSRIIIAFAHNASREKISQLVEQCGFRVHAVCRSGADVIREVRTLSGGVVISGYKLADMTANELSDSIGGIARLLFVASPANLAMIEYPAAKLVPSPIRFVEFRDAIRELSDLDDRTSHDSLHRRSPQETAMIARAKAILMESGMSEPEAHSYLQQRSMRERCRLIATVQRLLEEHGETI